MFDHLNLVLTLADDEAPQGLNEPSPGNGGNGGNGGDGGGNGEAGSQQPAGGSGDADTQTQSSPFGDSFLILMVGMLVIFFVMMTMSSRREKKKQQDLISSLRKGSKVQTVGGILGTIVEVHSSKIVLKVDENTNTRLAVSRGAVQRVLEEEKATEEEQEEAKEEK